MRKAKIVVKKKSGKRMWQLQKVQRRRNPGKITITCINFKKNSKSKIHKKKLWAYEKSHKITKK